MRRRSFLLAAAALGLALVGAGLLRRLGLGSRAAPAATPGPRAAGPEERLGLWASPDSERLLSTVADVIVPRDGEHPAASEIDLRPRLEELVRSNPMRRRFYETYWPGFELALRERVRFDARERDPALEPLLAEWYATYRRDPRRPVPRFFELLRQDVLRIYYSTPAGWAALGYTGPVHRSHPREASPSSRPHVPGAHSG